MAVDDINSLVRRTSLSAAVGQEYLATASAFARLLTLRLRTNRYVALIRDEYRNLGKSSMIFLTTSTQEGNRALFYMI